MSVCIFAADSDSLFHSPHITGLLALVPLAIYSFFNAASAVRVRFPEAMRRAQAISPELVASIEQRQVQVCVCERRMCSFAL